MRKYILWTMTLIGAIFILQAVILSIVTNFNVGNIMVFLVGALLFAYGMYGEKLPKNRTITILKATVALGSIFTICMMICIGVVGSNDTSTFKEDAVIVLGAAIHGDKLSLTLGKRLDKCIEYIRKNPNVIIVVSGGQGPQETITEALAMERYLISKGIPQEKIMKEEESTSTYTNLKYSKELLDRYFNKNYNVVIITNNFHAYRAGETAKKVGLSSTKYSAGLKWYLIPPTYLRETLAVLTMWLS